MGINEKRKKYNSIISNLNDALAGLVGRSQKDIQENNRKINPVSGTPIRHKQKEEEKEHKMELNP